MKNLELRVGGVPEHFNLPWHLAIKAGLFDELNIKALWNDYPSGTGSMVKALNKNEVDVAMLLTEGAVKAQAKDGDFEIISIYVQSPLIWGINVPEKSDLYQLDDISNAKFAISRFGSGSNLMAYLLAEQEELQLDENSFEIVNNLSGARELFKQGGDFVFLWEKFMTQPYVDSGEFRRIANLLTPWPCFVICVRKTLFKDAQNRILKMITVVLETAQKLKKSPIASTLIASEYSLKVSEVKEWLELTEWAQTTEIDPNLLQKVREKLSTLNLI